jgi:hypothetical protein
MFLLFVGMVVENFTNAWLTIAINGRKNDPLADG